MSLTMVRITATSTCFSRLTCRSHGGLEHGDSMVEISDKAAAMAQRR